MKINILAFGQVAGITGNNILVDEDVSDTESLKALLHQRYPQLSQLKFAIAVDKKMVYENIKLKESATVALLPPFSGG